MKHIYLVLCLGCWGMLSAQNPIELPHLISENVKWETSERQYHSSIWQTEVITNVSKPVLEVFVPKNSDTKKSAVIIAPGGGLYALSIRTEGRMVAEWLNRKGVAAFVLKYRLVPTKEDGVAEITQLSMTDPSKIMNEVEKVLPLSVADGLSAMRFVREHADDFGIDPNKIGFMGFSAGGAVTMGVGYGYSNKDRPNFLVPVYPWTDAQQVREPQGDCPPMFIVCATNDPLDLARGSIELYDSMQKAGKNVSLMMYGKGGHGFGLKSQGLPSDSWIERFYEWAVSENLILEDNP